MSVTTEHQLRRVLLDAYEALPAPDQAIMQLLAVIYDETAKTTLANCARSCDVPELKAGISPAGLGPLLERLAQTGLLVGANTRWLCHRLVVEDLTRRAVREGRFASMAQAVRKTIKVPGWDQYFYFQSYRQLLRELRIAFYLGDLVEMQGLLAVCAKNYPEDLAQYPPWLLIFNNPFDADSLRALPDELLSEALTAIFAASVRHFEPAPALLALAESLLAENRCADLVRYYLAEQALLRGDSVQAGAYLNAFSPGHPTDYAETLRGWVAFLQGADEVAITHYETALKLLRKRTGKRKIFFDSLSGVFYILALLAVGTPGCLRQALLAMAPVFDKRTCPAYPSLYRVLVRVVEVQQGQTQAPTPPDLSRTSPPIDLFFQLLASYWLKIGEPQRLRGPITLLLEQARQAGYRWFVAELDELSRQVGGGPALGTSPPGERRLTGLFRRKEPWEHALDALLDLSQSPAHSRAAPATVRTRLAWWIRWHDDGGCTISPREQKSDGRGQWTSGRLVALKRLYRSDALSGLSPQDREICACIRPVYDDYYGGSHYEISIEKALPLLVGHPLLFWEEHPTVRVDLVRGEPELLITPKGAQWRLELHPQIAPNATLKVVKETPTRLRVIVFNDAHRKIMALLGQGLLVPDAAKNRVLEAVAALANLVTVQSDLDAGVAQVQEVVADSLPHVHLLPFAAGLKIELRVRPFATEGPFYRPGVGGERVIAEIAGRRVQAHRDLRLERQRATQVVMATPTLSSQPAVSGEWLLPDPETCLEALLELQALGGQAVLEWPEGEKFQISRPATPGQLRLNIKRHRDWFAVDGELCLDEQVIDMRQLLALLEQTPGRFLPLGEGQFLALTAEFRQRLEALRGFGEPLAQGVRFHPLAIQALEPLVAEAGTVRVDSAWKAQLARLREAEALQPVTPSTLQAELRDYQVDGFRWLARLAHWGVGACLADDMGLGKTVQALALLLDRAESGPSLVVAPTSVCLNWLDEIRRFAPTLNPLVFGGGDREQILLRLGPFDVLICSYGLLQQEVERLTNREWQTIVLDEAQAIKNMSTKRSQAAMALRGAFRVITTGTPIENHLGELWNLFRFINPGLLGSLEHFNQHFAIPIERDQDTEARHRLKRWIQPFILRRLKSEVLAALPPRTEIVRRVELGPTEAALYEALRQQAVERLAKTDATDGQRSFHILAEIMKLRRACCHPRLVAPESGLEGAKLAVFEEILDELLENRHKALVFSQFVDHLALLRERLERKGVSHQYLDGSTPSAERKRAVDAFQSGQGDVFLISLKAGGLGLNLTAADYVIHMDPWWNPAVEDQASDRAHRIGQQRPVTIYRLVAQGTIEEKIVDLHHHKRDLADQVLEGTGVSGRISAEELLQLLQQT